MGVCMKLYRVLQVSGNAVFGEPTHGCMNFTNGHEIAGKILIVKRGECSFNRKVVFCYFLSTALVYCV